MATETVDELKSGTLCGVSHSFEFILSINGSISPFCLSFVPVLKETLENRGVLGQIRARVRAEVFSALDDQVSLISLLWS